MNFKDAMHATVLDYPGGADSLAPRMGIKSAAVLRSKANPNIDTHHMRLDEAITMMVCSGDYRVMHAMASDMGGVFSLLPIGEITEANIFALIMQATAKHGDVCKEFNDAMEDGHLSREEKKLMIEKVQNVISSLYQLKNSLEISND